MNFWRGAGIAPPLLALLCICTIARADITNTVEDISGVENLIGYAVGYGDSDAILEMTSGGLREKGTDIAVNINDKWHLGSISKSLTTILLGTLIAEGMLDVDTPLPELLTDIPNIDSGWNNISLRDVLAHRAGLPTNFGISVMTDITNAIDDRPRLRREALAEILANPPHNRDFLYSNVGYTLAGHVAEILTQEPWEHAIQERIFIPLAIPSAGFGAPKGERRLDQPVGHANFFGLWQKPMNPYDSTADNTPIIGPAGTIHMSLPDLLKYGQALLQMAKGHDNILPAEIFLNLTTPQNGLYAGGMITSTDDAAGGDFLWHNGSNTMWYAILTILPAKNRVIAMVTNRESTQTRDTAWRVINEIARRQPID